MGKRGPPKKPRRLKQIAGTVRPCRDNPNEPEFTGKAKCPTWLSAEAKREWKRLAPELMPLGLLQDAHRAAFAAYCESWAEFHAYSALIHKVGRETAIVKGYVNAQDKVLNQMNRWGAKFGLSPSDQSGVVTTPRSDGKKKDRFFA